MSFIARRALSTSARRFTASTPGGAGGQALKQESKRNPELMILGGVMVAAFAGAGYFWGRNPTSSTSEAPVKIADSGMPWEGEASSGKYSYHPAGDSSAAPRDAPSAINVVVIPDVNLPKHLHEKYNKWGKDGY
jgi:hypothetical protein